MDEFLGRLLGPATAIDGIVVFLFAVVAVIFFLAPVLGYQAEKRQLVLISLYLLVGYGLIVLLQLIVQYLVYLGSSDGEHTAKPTFHLVYLFGIVKLLIFIASQGALVVGLQGLKRGSAV